MQRSEAPVSHYWCASLTPGWTQHPRLSLEAIPELAWTEETNGTLFDSHRSYPSSGGSFSFIFTGASSGCRLWHLTLKTDMYQMYTSTRCVSQLFYMVPYEKVSHPDLVVSPFFSLPSGDLFFKTHVPCTVERSLPQKRQLFFTSSFPPNSHIFPFTKYSSALGLGKYCMFNWGWACKYFQSWAVAICDDPSSSFSFPL